MRRPLTPAQRELAYRAEAAGEVARAYGRVFATEDGQRVLAHILHGLCRADGNLRGPSVQDTYYLLGRRDVALEINALANGHIPKTADEVTND